MNYCLITDPLTGVAGLGKREGQMVSDYQTGVSREEPYSQPEPVASLLRRLAEEYEAARRGLAHAACDYSRRALLEAHLSAVTACQAELGLLLGEAQALELIRACLEQVDRRLAAEEEGPSPGGSQDR
jgi:hypothetical protein